MLDPVTLAKCALLDINKLLQEGFDTNIHECQIDEVKDTIRDLIEYIKANDPEWELP
jgi:hypothetical protein